MPIESPPTIVHPHEPVPNPNQGRTEFNSNMQATFNVWPATSASQQSMGVWMKAAADQTEIWAGEAEAAVTNATNAGAAQVNLATDQVQLAGDAATRAETARDMAFGTANIAGNWADQTGAFSAFDAVYNGGKVWVAKVDIPDITLNQPTVADATWMDYFAEVSGAEVVSSPTDTTLGRITNTQWDFKRAVLSTPIDEGVGLNIDTLSAGTSVMMRPESSSGLFPPSGITDGNYWHITVEALYVGALIMRATPYYFNIVGTHPSLFYRIKPRNAANFSGIPWQRIASGAPEDGKLYGQKDGGWEEVSGLQVPQNRLVGRVSAGTGSPEYLTKEQAMTLLGAASNGDVKDTGITLSGVGIPYRATSGAGAMTRGSAGDILAFLGIATYSGTLSMVGATYTGVNYVATRVGGMVMMHISATIASTTDDTTRASSNALPAAIRPPFGQFGKGTTSTSNTGNYWFMASVASTGIVSLDTNGTASAPIGGYVSLCYPAA